jgi:hypothetical protein
MTSCESSINGSESLGMAEPIIRRRKSIAYHFQDPKDLLMAVTSVVKNRKGSVLGRQMILKSDHFETAINTKLDVHLHGAPNFRMADMNIFGVAQPTVTGIKTVLTLLRCHSDKFLTSPAVWISAREEPLIYINRKPFVIRDSKSPFENISTYQGIMTNRLEQMEVRLKEDILQELGRWNGLVLVHDERSNKEIVPVWMAVDHIQTPKEVFLSLKEQGFNVEYERIPVSPEQTNADIYFDEFLKVVCNQPVTANLIFNCGMGVGRTTFSMIIAMIIRRYKMLWEGKKDPLQVQKRRRESLTDSEKRDQSMIELINLLNQGKLLFI